MKNGELKKTWGYFSKGSWNQWDLLKHTVLQNPSHHNTGFFFFFVPCTLARISPFSHYSFQNVISGTQICSLQLFLQISSFCFSPVSQRFFILCLKSYSKYFWSKITFNKIKLSKYIKHIGNFCGKIMDWIHIFCLLPKLL